MSTVIRVEKNRNFVVMNNEFLRNKEMSLKAKGLLALCLSLPDTWNYSMNGLAAICKESLTSIRSTLRELEEHGHLVRNKKNGENGRFFYEYILYETPDDKKPLIQNAHAVNVDVQNAYVANDIQESIEEESIKKENIEELNLYIEANADNSIKLLLKEYLEMRKEIKAPIDIKGLKLLFSRLDKLSNGNKIVQKMMLESATMNKWKNVFRPKDEEIEAASKALVENLRSFYNI